MSIEPSSIVESISVIFWYRSGEKSIGLYSPFFIDSYIYSLSNPFKNGIEFIRILAIKGNERMYNS